MNKAFNPKMVLLITIFGLTTILGFGQNQPMEIHGVVTGTNDQVLSGVSIKIKNSQTGTTTNEDGTYQIIAKTGDVLQFSSVGYQPFEIKIGNSSNINPQLKILAEGLNEVVVVGYGTQVKKDLTAAVSQINVDKLKDFTSANSTQLLQGTAPGVTVKQTTGAPGKEFEVNVRGLGSLGASSAPLYVIDGFPIGNSVGPNLDPDDIASISILKDAVSTAIYGARGANGVVLITTKKAKAGQSSLEVNAKYGFQNVPDSRKTKMMDGPEFAEFKKESFMDKIRYFENREPDISEVPLDFRNPEQTKISTNWFDEILHNNAPFQNYNVTLSQGNGDMHALISAGYIDQQGAIIHSDFKNYSLRANVDGTVKNLVKLGLNIVASQAESNWDDATEGRSNVVGSALLVDPRAPVYNDDGTFNLYIGNHDGILGFPNPVLVLTQVMRRKHIGDALANGFVEVPFFQYFKFRSSVNAHFNFYNFKNFVPSTIGGQLSGPPPRDASETDIANRTIGLSADQLLTFAKSFGESNLDVLVGYSAQKETFKTLTGTGTQYADNLTPFLGSAAIKSATSGENGWSLLAYFTRVNYSFKDKYLFSGTYRREGSSRFGEKSKYGDFPALSAGWRISQESFFPKLDWLQDLKLRASWGKTGNNNIGNYSSLAFMNPSNYILGGNFASGLVVGNLANPNLKWEKSTQTDVGLDFTAFGGSLTFSGDYYKRITSDMLLPVDIPAISGFTTVLDNIGKVQNKGFEFNLGYNGKIGEVKLWGNFNISINRNKVLEIRGQNDELWFGSLYADYNVSKVGRPIGMIYGFKTLGIFQNQAEIDRSPIQDGAIPGSFIYQDSNGDGTVEYDVTDMVEIGNPWPKFTWGATLGTGYKGFDLTILFTGAQGYDIFRQIESSTVNQDGVFNVLAEDKFRWRSEQQPGDNYWPTTNFWKWERESNSRYVHNASHAWVRDITLGYTLPRIKSIPFGLKVFASANNVFLFTHYPGSNPDIDNNGGINPGLDDEAYPVPRTFTLGANLTF